MVWRIDDAWRWCLKNLFGRLADKTDNFVWRVVGFLVAFSTLVAFYFGLVHLDLYWHPWLREVSFQWWYIFTTPHGITLYFLHNNTLWWGLACLFSFIFSIGIAITKKKEHYS